MQLAPIPPLSVSPLLLLLLLLPSSQSFVAPTPRALPSFSSSSSGCSPAAARGRTGAVLAPFSIPVRSLDNHIEIDADFPGLRKLHSSPDIFLVDDMLEGGECAEIVEAAKAKGLELSPVAYAGWTEDAAIWSRSRWWGWASGWDSQ
ncbi:hypothetical protein GUITHDRAFT_136595 [Guillardia theta CCMP2712]|uniref:Uncharacterized protein n=1 Tax=Guillardia theta (strain CCMP2712) TaxID=905079 RepID=L1JK50_GUITC|nr:hypothetical protein GUITHDRAFT_136595 [Guillardia theta CCMP2712]EKX48460.1 hypothetical protein GUITHDRAFT_136595 [Guillardia theta CCMP2712]|eukprot:XP_005835440.1 hypothetical protein GUITHDRAFT_136595 [Guillardia theta CCMP2712]